MKKISYIPVLLLMTTLLMVSCDGLLNTDSERYTFDEDYRVSSEHDSLYAFVGILSQLQKIGDRYVLLGELRGDLMETTDDASLYLKQMQEFNITSDNPYASTKEYYAVINNCNYVIQYVDTSVQDGSDKPNYRVMAAAKAIRAWTYLQLVLNYGSANYITNAILTSDDVEKTYDEVDLSELCGLLIDDLLPFKDIEPLNLGTFASFDAQLSLFPIKFLLGDLYLWSGSYQNAARMYYDLMYDETLLITDDYASTWVFENNIPTEKNDPLWYTLFTTTSTETLGALASSPDYGNAFTLDTLCALRQIAPTDVAINNWAEQVYFYSTYAATDGDLRADGSVGTTYKSKDGYTIIENDDPMILKYLYLSKEETEKVIIVYRNSLLYLRYAEAINQLGYSQLAFEAIKSGLNPTVSAKATISKETTSSGSQPYYLNFSWYKFTNNIGTRMRGLGNQDDDTTNYIIPANVDTIEYVEDKIVEELALETAFEGNRFHDLMRVALRRNDPAYLADKVSKKYTTNKDAINTKLLDTANWYLPK